MQRAKEAITKEAVTKQDTTAVTSAGRMAGVLLAVAGTLLALVLVELLAQRIYPKPGRLLFVPDPVVGYRHQPNQRVWANDETREYGSWFTTNKHGDPDQDRPFEKAEGVYRVAVIGDSMVEAAQVLPEERFATLLEGQLTAWAQERGGSPQKVEVLNFGTAGYGTAQEWLNYREHVRRFDPDLVLLFFLPGNDIKNNSYELEVVRSCRLESAPFYSPNQAGELVLQNPQFYEKAAARYSEEQEGGWRGALEALRERVRLVDLVYRVYGAVRSGSVTAGTGGRLDQNACQTETTLELYNYDLQQTDESWQEAWRTTAAMLQQFARDVEQDGADFHVVVLTGPWEVYPETRELVLASEDQEGYDWELPQRMSEAMLERLGLEGTLLLPALHEASAAENELIHYRYNGHYTPFGHQVIARELLPVLQGYIGR